MAYLFPCVLIENFAGAEIASPSNTETENKWSTSNNTEVPISLDTDILKNNDKSLLISYTGTSARRYIKRGVDETPFDIASVNNPYGTDGTYPYADFTWATNIGMWLYTTDQYQTDGSNSEMLNVGYYEINDLGGASAYWNSSINEVDKWKWFDVEVDMSYNDIDRFFIGIDEVNSGNIYINDYVVFKRSTSNKRVYDSSNKTGYNAATGEYTWKNGITFELITLEESQYSYSISGKIIGSHFTEIMDQLKNMETKNLITHNMFRRPAPKYSDVRDYGLIKTYLLSAEFYNVKNPTVVEKLMEPVVITNLVITREPGKPNIINFSAILRKYCGL